MNWRVLIGLFTLFISGPNQSLRAGDGMIDPEQFGTKSQIIFAETIEIDAGIRGKVVKQADLVADSVNGDGSVDLPLDLMEQFLDRGAPRHQVALFKDGNEPSPEVLAEATAKDEAEWQVVEEKVKNAFKTAGLVADPATEAIVYFYFGKAKMRVIECLKGSLQPGDEVTVTWENVPHREGCPNILPWKGKQVWMIDEAAKAGGLAKWIAGYYADLEMAKKARDEFQSKGK